ncbi:MAG TPA: DUF881 domain-containing protein [Firmicutes bacterium]|nr:DUF881 domain-containing protein [Bacillota bacterium]
MDSKKWPVYVAAVSVLLGVLLVAQFRTQEYIGTSVVPTRRLEDLTDMLRKAEAQREALEKEVGVLRRQLVKAWEGEHAVETVRQELARVQAVAGLVPMTGPGVVLVLNDSRKQAQPGESADLFLVHDEDILKVVNELFAAGAEAVSVNGQRMIATSEIRCAGPTISVNNTRIGAPYQIVAIGDPQTLDSALHMRDGIIDTLKAWGIQVRITQVPSVTVPAYKGSLYFKYAKPVTSGSETQ